MLTLSAISPLSFLFNPKHPAHWMGPSPLSGRVFHLSCTSFVGTVSQTSLVDSVSSIVGNEKEPLKVYSLSI